MCVCAQMQPSMHVCLMCECVCVWVNLCVYGGDHSRVSLSLTALKLMIQRPKNQQMWPLTCHNREHNLPVDVFEGWSSFFSVSTSLPQHNRCIHYTNSNVTATLVLYMRKCYHVVRGMCMLIGLWLFYMSACCDKVLKSYEIFEFLEVRYNISGLVYGVDQKTRDKAKQSTASAGRPESRMRSYPLLRWLRECLRPL